MTSLEEIAAALRDSKKLDPASRDLLLQFLAASAPLLESLEGAALRTLMEWLAGGPSIPAVPAVERLDGAQVRALLDLTQTQMDALVAERREEVAAAHAAVERLGQTALALLARLLVAAL
jgi:hypothetical protein